MTRLLAGVLIGAALAVLIAGAVEAWQHGIR